MLTYGIETELLGGGFQAGVRISQRVVGFCGPYESDGTGAGPGTPSSILRSGKGPTLPHPCEPEEVWIFNAAARMKSLT